MWKIKLYLIQSRMEIKKAMLDYFEDSADESDYQDLTEFVEILRENHSETDFLDSFHNELLKAKTQKFDVDEVNKHIESINSVDFVQILLGFLTSSDNRLMKSIHKEETSIDKATILLLKDKIGRLERKNKLLTDQLVDYLDIS